MSVCANLSLIILILDQILQVQLQLQTACVHPVQLLMRTTGHSQI